MITRLLFSTLIASLLIVGSSAQVIWQEAESLSETGGWSNDPQHIDLMGSPYLLATGVGTSVDDAHGEVTVGTAGSYRLWVRCRDWYPSHSPGTFQVSVGGQASPATFGKAETDEWQWVDGGRFELAKGPVELRLKDLSGWWGRVDALVLTMGDFKPADDLEELNQQRVRFNGVSTEIREQGTFDVVVVGGGSSGLGAAIAAARNGIKVAFIQDRPVLGGNGSDEIQVPPMGYIGKSPDQVNVTGLAEEIFPAQGWTAFASSAHIERLVRAEENIALHLNTRAIDVEMATDTRIQSVIAIDVRSGQRMRFTAPLFVDTTGHGWIGYYAGAEYRHGTEGQEEFGETLAPLEADKRTMGNSLYKAEFADMGKPSSFVTPDWAYHPWKSRDDFSVQGRQATKSTTRPEDYDSLPPATGRVVATKGLKKGGAYTWFVEFGGTMDTIADAEKIRDELFRIHVGLWGYAKQEPANKNLKMVWLNYVPGVRESRRLMGDYIMTQKDWSEPSRQPDAVTFTDWGIDDHHPNGFFTQGIAVMHPYQGLRVDIPYRSLYSKNIDNLFMAGRCMSASHLGLAGVRVQRPMTGTGQAVGTAAAIATRGGCSPREIHQSHLKELQQRLLRDGCFIVGVRNEDPEDLALTAITRDRAVIDGWNREIQGKSKAVLWTGRPIELTLREPKTIRSVHVSLRNRSQSAAFDVGVLSRGEWRTVASTGGQRAQRRHVLKFDPVEAERVRLRLRKSSGPVGVCEVRIYEAADPG